MTEQGKISVIEEIVKNYIEQYIAPCDMPVKLEYRKLSKEDKRDVLQIGTSILCTKWDIGPKGGGFVKSVVNNDLTGAVMSADKTNIKMLALYVNLMLSAQKPDFSLEWPR